MSQEMNQTRTKNPENTIIDSSNTEMNKSEFPNFSSHKNGYSQRWESNEDANPSDVKESESKLIHSDFLGFTKKSEIGLKNSIDRKDYEEKKLDPKVIEEEKDDREFDKSSATKKNTRKVSPQMKTFTGLKNTKSK